MTSLRYMALLVGAGLWAWTALLGAQEGGAKDGEKKGFARSDKPPKTDCTTLASIAAKLEPDAALTPQQRAKISALLDDLNRRYEEFMRREDVKAAREELDKAKKNRDADGERTASVRLKELTSGFVLKDEIRKGLLEILTNAQAEKLWPGCTAAKDPKREDKDRRLKKTADDAKDGEDVKTE